MARYQSSGDIQEDIRHYQKRLIPLNIFVCILCIVSIVTMMFVPFLEVNLSKIIGSEEIKSYVSKTIEDNLKGATDQTNSARVGSQWTLAAPQEGDGDGSGNGDGSQDTANTNELMQKLIGTITTSVVNPLLSALGKGSLAFSFSAFDSLKVMLGGSAAFKTKIVDLATNFTDELMAVVNDMFDENNPDNIINTIVNDSLPEIIDASIDALLEQPDDQVPPEAKEALRNLDRDNLKQLAGTLNEPTTPQGFVDKIGDAAPELMQALTGEKPGQDEIDEMKDALTTEINTKLDLLREQDPEEWQKVQNGNFKLETFACLMFSDALADLLKDMNNQTSVPYAHIAATDGDNNGENPEEPAKPAKIYTSFSAILADMTSGEGEGEGEGIDIQAKIQEVIDGALSQLGNDLDTVAQIYGYVFIFFAVFMALWGILFLFSFFHIFAKNKRFCMWYVKLLCWLPGIIWLALTLAGIPAVMSAIVGLVGANEIPVGVMTAAIGGISSWGTGVSYICYWVLWLVSIFWAFPIKHKIRKLKKQAKYENY